MSIIQHFVSWSLNHPIRIMKGVSASRFSREFEVLSSEIEGFPLLTIQKSPQTDLHILFFHGGAYITDASPMHRKMITYLIDQMSCKVTFVDYPLAPEYTAEKVKSVVRAAYLYIAERYASEQICLFGDSAGGGLALALRQLIRDECIEKIPGKTVCCSPWLDVSMSCSDYSAQAKTEKILTQKMLMNAGKKYAGSFDTKNSFVSPIYGKMDHLGDIFVSVSKDEIFLPDVHLLKEKTIKADGTTLTVLEQADAVHDYVINTRSPASQQTFQAIKRFITGQPHTDPAPD